VNGKSYIFFFNFISRNLRWKKSKSVSNGFCLITALLPSEPDSWSCCRTTLAPILVLTYINKEIERDLQEFL